MIDRPRYFPDNAPLVHPHVPFSRSALLALRADVSRCRVVPFERLRARATPEDGPVAERRAVLSRLRARNGVQSERLDAVLSATQVVRPHER